MISPQPCRDCKITIVTKYTGRCRECSILEKQRAPKKIKKVQIKEKTAETPQPLCYLCKEYLKPNLHVHKVCIAKLADELARIKTAERRKMMGLQITDKDVVYMKHIHKKYGELSPFENMDKPNEVV